MYVEFNQYEKLIVIEAIKEKIERLRRTESTQRTNDDRRDLENALDKLNG